MNKLNAHHIKLNQPLPWNVFDAQSNLLLRKGYVVERQAQLDVLLARGLFVAETDFAIHQTTTRTADNAPLFNPFHLWDEIFAKLVNALKNAAGESQFEQKIGVIAHQLLTLIDSDIDAALAGILLKDGSRYAYAHSLHVAILAAVIARRLGWPEEGRHTAVLTALSMNVAMIELQMALLAQQEPLTAEQRHEVDLHPQKGAQFLRAKGVTCPLWLEAVRLHHQQQPIVASKIGNPDGQAMSQLLRVLDVFCAKVSPRAYRRALQPPVAAREIFVQERQVCAEFVDALIKEIGLYMPGTFVKLENGEVSLVIKRGTSVNTPRVVSLTRGDGMPFLDLAKRDTAKPEFAIKTVVPREKIMHALNLSKIWGY